MTLALLVAGLVLVLLDDDLGALGGGEHLDRDAGLVQAGRSDLVTVDDHDHREGQRLADTGLDLVDLDDVAHGNLLLLAASAHDCVHGGFTLLGLANAWEKDEGRASAHRGSTLLAGRWQGQNEPPGGW